MNGGSSTFVKQEKRKQIALVSLAVLSSAIVAFAPRNERRLFILPELPVAYAVMEAPEETDLRSPIFASGFGARHRPRPAGFRPRSGAPAAPAVPSAFFAEPEPPLSVDDLGQPFAFEPMGPIDVMPVDLRDFGVPPVLRPGTSGLPVAISSVPEPASWALMIAGFGLIGSALRHRRAQPGAFIRA